MADLIITYHNRIAIWWTRRVHIWSIDLVVPEPRHVRRQVGEETTFKASWFALLNRHVPHLHDVRLVWVALYNNRHMQIASLNMPGQACLRAVPVAQRCNSILSLFFQQP